MPLIGEISNKTRKEHSSIDELINKIHWRDVQLGMHNERRLSDLENYFCKLTISVMRSESSVRQFRGDRRAVLQWSRFRWHSGRAVRQQLHQRPRRGSPAPASDGTPPASAGSGPRWRETWRTPSSALPKSARRRAWEWCVRSPAHRPRGPSCGSGSAARRWSSGPASRPPCAATPAPSAALAPSLPRLACRQTRRRSWTVSAPTAPPAVCHRCRGRQAARLRAAGCHDSAGTHATRRAPSAERCRSHRRAKAIHVADSQGCPSTSLFRWGAAGQRKLEGGSASTDCFCGRRRNRGWRWGRRYSPAENAASIEHLGEGKKTWTTYS